jgi:phage-related minor tail protein
VEANKGYMVGERGPEWFSPSRNGYIHPNGSGAQQRIGIYVKPSEYFDVIVDERAAGVAAPMAMSARNSGAAGGYQAVVQRQKRSFP